MRNLLLLISFAFLSCADDPTPMPIHTNNSTNTGTNNSTNTATNNSTNTATNNTTTTNNTTNQAGCVPSRAAFANALPFIEEGCQSCHGATPTFGAPMPLMDYDAMIAGPEGERIVDKMVTRLANKTMPPANATQLTHQGLDTLTEWASCGRVHPDHAIGLSADRPVLTAPAQAPNLPFFDVTPTEFALGPNELDRYECFVVRAPITEKRIIRRIEPVIDDSRVIHHFLVKLDHSGPAETNYQCPGFPPGDSYAYVWGPGQEPLQFPAGGIPMEAGDAFILQIHYNNGAGAEGVRDSSGIRVYHDAPGGPEYALAEVGPGVAFGRTQAGETTSADSTCTVRSEVSLFATWPHMHEIGYAFDQRIQRSGTSAFESIIALTGWAFEAQLIYDTPMTLKVGDKITTGCTWDNYKDFDVVPGLGSADEMCFSFMYVTPNIQEFCR